MNLVLIIKISLSTFLGYCFDENNKDLNEFIKFFKRKREERVDEMIRRCNIEGYHITKEDLIKAIFLILKLMDVHILVSF